MCIRSSSQADESKKTTTTLRHTDCTFDCNCILSDNVNFAGSWNGAESPIFDNECIRQRVASFRGRSMCGQQRLLSFVHSPPQIAVAPCTRLIFVDCRTTPLGGQPISRKGMPSSSLVS